MPQGLDIAMASGLAVPPVKARAATLHDTLESPKHFIQAGKTGYIDIVLACAAEAVEAYCGLKHVNAHCSGILVFNRAILMGFCCFLSSVYRTWQSN